MKWFSFLALWEDILETWPRSNLSALEIGRHSFGIANCQFRRFIRFECIWGFLRYFQRTRNLSAIFTRSSPQIANYKNERNEMPTTPTMLLRRGKLNVFYYSCALCWIPRAWKVKPRDVQSSMITINPRQFFCDVKKMFTTMQREVKPNEYESDQCLFRRVNF